MTPTTPAHPLKASAASALKGRIRVPGDKSISHRALIFGSVSLGETRVSGMLEGEDVLRTAEVLRRLGARIERLNNGVWRIHGVGSGGLTEPDDILDCGNSGTGARLLMGLVASHDFNSVFTGDASLRRRPMARVTGPLGRIGARFITRRGERLPITVIGAQSPLPIEYRLPVASAQVKSAILLAGLNTPGKTIVIEPERTRDHSENMLRFFGAEVEITDLDDNARRIVLTGQPELKGGHVQVPGDPSSAAFPLLAAAIVPGSDIVVESVGINPLRTGLFETLREMGAEIEFLNVRDEGGEPVADICMKHSRLRGVTVPPERAPSMIDEYPVLAAIAAFAHGKTIVRGAKELRVKESDRISAMARGLLACGVTIEELDDGFVVTGTGAPPQGNARILTEMDHRIAMSFLVLGQASAKPVTIDDAAMIDTSFPGFAALMTSLGAKIDKAE